MSLASTVLSMAPWWFAAALLYILWHFWKFRKASGPFLFPLVGSLPSVYYNRSHMHDWITKLLSQTGGTYLTYLWAIPGLPIRPVVVTSDPRNMEHILKTKFENYPKGPQWQSAFHDLLGSGIFNTDGELWLNQRKTAALEFTGRSMRHTIANSINKIIKDRLWPILEEAAQKASSIDLQDVLLRFTFDNICHLAFGVNPGSLAPGLPRNCFADAFDLATEATLGRLILPGMLWRAKRALGLGMEKEMVAALEGVNKFVLSIIRQRKVELGGTATEYNDLLSRFMQKKDAQGMPYSEIFLRDVALNFILAGRDTSSVALTWFFWLLTQNPRVENKVITEIQEVAQRKPRQEQDNLLSFVDLEELHYMKAALSEALRLYPSVPQDFKYVLANETLPSGTRVVKGSTITYSIYAMGRMESIWGPDCLQFKPERWLIPQNNRLATSSDAYKFMAFNAGPRICLGKDLAYLQMKSIAAAILMNWKISVVPNHDVSQKMSLTLFMKHGLRVTLRPRSPL